MGIHQKIVQFIHYVCRQLAMAHNDSSSLKSNNQNIEGRCCSLSGVVVTSLQHSSYSDVGLTPLHHCSYSGVVPTPLQHCSYSWVFLTVLQNCSYSGVAPTPIQHCSYSNLFLIKLHHCSYSDVVPTPLQHRSYSCVLRTPLHHCSYSGEGWPKWSPLPNRMSFHMCARCHTTEHRLSCGSKGRNDGLLQHCSNCG